jgi:hypothetical protein
LHDTLCFLTRNSHDKISSSKCTTPWHLLPSEYCATTPGMQFHNILVTSKGYLVSLHSHPLPSSPRSVAATNLSVLWICLFWAFHMNGLVPYMDSVSLVPVSLRLVHVAVYISISLILRNRIMYYCVGRPHFTCLLVPCWMSEEFPLEECCSDHLCARF